MSAEMALPRERTSDAFIQYLRDCFSGYELVINRLTLASDLSRKIFERRNDILSLSNQIMRAVEEYLGGNPSRAYDELQSGIKSVANQLTTLNSLPVDQGKIGPLYRVARCGSGPIAKGRIFHPPFELRHKVGQHRYGIPGFPCLYLGDSLELCISELRIPPNQLWTRAVAEFAVTSGTQVKVLDFGYRPAALADMAFGRDIEDAKPHGKANPSRLCFWSATPRVGHLWRHRPLRR